MNTSTKILLGLLMPVCFICNRLQAQNTFPSTGAAGVGTITPDASSLLEIKSTTKGLLMPRMTLVQRNAIISPATGLMIYQTNSTPGFYYYSGSAWTAVKPKAWNLTGNAGTDAAINFIGTTDAQPLIFKVNNAKAGLLDYVGSKGNSSFGYQSLNSNTGNFNSAFGYESLFSNTTGMSNTANGTSALYSNITGNYNVAIGVSALRSNTTGTYNSASGAYSLYSNTTGDFNVANGFQALFLNTAGYANTATGYLSLQNNTTGLLNTAYGSETLLSNTTGNYNTATGYMALYSNTTGNENTATGLYALHYNTQGSYNTATGRDALFNNTIGSYNTANGKEALFNNTSGGSNVANGNKALYSNTTGGANTATGYSAMLANTTGNNNTANGFDALAYNTTGDGNTASGYAALIDNTTGVDNTTNGAFSLYNNTTGNYNTANGYYSLNNNTTGVSNTAGGNQSLRYNTTGSLNTANGTNSLFSNTTGVGNTANGSQALSANTEGNFNTANGHFAGYNDVSYFNTEIGAFAGYGVTNGEGNTYVGYFAGPTVAGFTNSGAFGQSATPTASSQIRIGNSSVTSIGGQVGWSTFSDGRFKKNIKENVPGLEFIKQLHPITYNLDIIGLNKKTGVDKKISLSNEKSRSAENAAIAQQEKNIYTGFVAQDVEKAAKKSGYDFSGVDAPKNDNDLYGLRYAEFVVPLVKAVQELASQNDSLTNSNANLSSTLKDVITQLSDIKKQIAQLNIAQQQCCANSNNISAQTTSDNQFAKSNFSGDAARLEQNIPNPFSGNTVIRYYIPSKTNNAQLIISDVNGHVLKTIVLTTKGNGQATINAGTLSQGNYFYSLVIDGKKSGTKQMVLTK